ncbi:MAG: hypothetical protein JW786_01515, partial [Desulfobacterales bacterium]|nr:hypothetical protein [Desulfobacterales bacterium]
MMKRYAIRMAALISAFILLTGCAHYIVNEQSHNFDANSGYRFDALDPGASNSDSFLAFHLNLCYQATHSICRKFVFYPGQLNRM